MSVHGRETIAVVLLAACAGAIAQSCGPPTMPVQGWDDPCGPASSSPDCSLNPNLTCEGMCGTYGCRDAAPFGVPVIDGVCGGNGGCESSGCRPPPPQPRCSDLSSPVPQPPAVEPTDSGRCPVGYWGTSFPLTDFPHPALFCCVACRDACAVGVLECCATDALQEASSDAQSDIVADIALDGLGDAADGYVDGAADAPDGG
jgi:hypothetical protein